MLLSCDLDSLLLYSLLLKENYTLKKTRAHSARCVFAYKDNMGLLQSSLNIVQCRAAILLSDTARSSQIMKVLLRLMVVRQLETR